MHTSSDDRSINPLISIVTVTYNAENYLEETIQSILSQDYPHVEYIVIDGGSIDNTAGIVDKYSSSIDKFISEKDFGVYDAMNKALSHINGQWVNFMNSGDTFVDKSVLTNIAKCLNNKTDVAYGDHYFLSGNGRTLRQADINNIYSNITFNHQSVFYKSNIFKEYKYDTSYSIVADYDLHMRLYNAGKVFQYLRFPVANFLSGGAHSQNRTRMLIESLSVIVRHAPSEIDVRDSYLFKVLINENICHLSQKDLQVTDIYGRIKNKIKKLIVSFCNRNAGT